MTWNYNLIKLITKFLFYLIKTMKLRKNRGVSQGSSNFKTFIVSNPSFTKINQTLALKNTHKK